MLDKNRTCLTLKYPQYYKWIPYYHRNRSNKRLFSRIINKNNECTAYNPYANQENNKTLSFVETFVIDQIY